VYAVGLHEDNIEAFLLDGGKLDILIEECDDLFMKLFSRERARYHGIPVIMETSDKGLLNVERFDQEPHRPLFHNLIGDMDSRKLQNLSPKDRIQFQLRIVGTRDTVSPRLLAGLFEIGTTTKSWPQLASAISLVRPIPLKSYTGTRKLLVLLSQVTKYSMTSFQTRSKYGADSSAGCWYCR